MELAGGAALWTALAVGLLATGVIAGVLAGLLGVGGGIVIVPVLSWMLAVVALDPGVTQHLAVGTSLATIIPTAIASARSHNSKGSLDWAVLKAWAPALILGAAAGGVLSRYASGDVLRLVFGIVALLVAANMMMPKQMVVADKLPESPSAVWTISGAVGVFSALMGIGGGTLAVPIQSAFSVQIRKAVGTASAMGLLIAVPAVIGFIWSGWGVQGLPPLSVGYVSLPAVALIVPATYLCAPLGAGIAHRVDQPMLRRLFAIFLGITALRMLYVALG